MKAAERSRHRTSMPAASRKPASLAMPTGGSTLRAAGGYIRIIDSHYTGARREAKAS
jgi:hypothetical protein